MKAVIVLPAHRALRNSKARQCAASTTTRTRFFVERCCNPATVVNISAGVPRPSSQVNRFCFVKGGQEVKPRRKCSKPGGGATANPGGKDKHMSPNPHGLGGPKKNTQRAAPPRSATWGVASRSHGPHSGWRPPPQSVPDRGAVRCVPGPVHCLPKTYLAGRAGERTVQQQPSAQATSPARPTPRTH